MIPRHAHEPPRYTYDDANKASEMWGFNCGPSALCAVTHKTPDELRPHLLDFEEKGYTNPTLMLKILDGLGVDYEVKFKEAGDRNQIKAEVISLIEYGLLRIQWSGPWINQHPIARYHHTHWVAVRKNNFVEIFDGNAMLDGGWLESNVWLFQLVPWLLNECEPKADGECWITHAIEIRESS